MCVRNFYNLTRFMLIILLNSLFFFLCLIIIAKEHESSRLIFLHCAEASVHRRRSQPPLATTMKVLETSRTAPESTGPLLTQDHVDSPTYDRSLTPVVRRFNRALRHATWWTNNGCVPFPLQSSVEFQRATGCCSCVHFCDGSPLCGGGSCLLQSQKKN